MWKLLDTLLGHKDGRCAALSSNATSLTPEELLGLISQIEEQLIILDLRRSSEVARLPFIIPGALLTTRAKLLDLADWIPPQAIVVLYGADNISAHLDLLALLPRDAHFYLLERGIKSWRQARLPMEPVNQSFLEKAPIIWRRDFAGGCDPTTAKQGITHEEEGRP